MNRSYIIADLQLADVAYLVIQNIPIQKLQLWKTLTLPGVLAYLCFFISFVFETAARFC